MVPSLQVATETGVVEGLHEHDGSVQTFRGIPYAAPPTGALRWRPPQPASAWQGVRPARDFGPRCSQQRVFADIVYRDEMAEDCLYLNIWAPQGQREGPLPVMVWIHGGGFVNGSGSEPRQDGAQLARQGVVVVSINYRLGILGYFAHPELTCESDLGASGNQALLDQVAALGWVHRNIAAFGGDSANVTVFGESAGSLSVSALMAAGPARGLFHRAIGQSGAFFPAPHSQPPSPLAESEVECAAFGESIGASSLDALRGVPVDELVRAAHESPTRFAPIIDGHFLAAPTDEAFAKGEQSAVPLLVGWNADEIRAMAVLFQKPTAESFASQTRERFGAVADRVLGAYPAASDAQAIESAAELGSDLFIGCATWQWLETHARTGRAPVYGYSFERKIPLAPGGWNGLAATREDVGARHAGEIEYVFGTLDWQQDVPWEPEDRALSARMLAYWANFARTGDPNGDGLPPWPSYDHGAGREIMHLDATSRAAPDPRRSRYALLAGL